MKIPPQAKSVFKGEIFEVFQWEQELFDGTTATFERAKRADTTEVIAVKDGKIWYAEEEQPLAGKYLTFFGGRVEPGEDPEVGARRELLEEAGFTCQSLELYQSVMPASKLDWTVYLYIAQGCESTQAQNPDAGERISVQSCTFEEFIQKILNQEIKTSAHFIFSIYNAVYREPAKLEEFKKQLGL